MTGYEYNAIRAIFVMKGGARHDVPGGDPQLRIKTNMVDSFVNRVVEWFKLEDWVSPRDHDAILASMRVRTVGDETIFDEEQFSAFAKRLLEMRPSNRNRE